MSKIAMSTDAQLSNGGAVQKLINTNVVAWHATIASGSAVDETAGFTDPPAAEADRIPQLALAGGGTPGAYTITGTYSGNSQTDEITTVAAATVKGSKPFDTITRLQGPDPGANLDLQQGDAYADPPAASLWTGATGGVVAVQLSGEDAPKTMPALPANIDWKRRVLRVDIDNHAITDSYLVW